MKMSDDLRKFTDTYDLNALQIYELKHIADRIDAETVELPKDADGVPINVGDVVYLDDGREAKVYRIELTNGKDAIRESITVNIQGMMHSLAVNIPSSLTHTYPDSWERIAHDIETSKGTVLISEKTLDDWADRIRKLAKEDK